MKTKRYLHILLARLAVWLDRRVFVPLGVWKPTEAQQGFKTTFCRYAWHRTKRLFGGWWDERYWKPRFQALAKKHRFVGLGITASVEFGTGPSWKQQCQILESMGPLFEEAATFDAQDSLAKGAQPA